MTVHELVIEYVRLVGLEGRAPAAPLGLAWVKRETCSGTTVFQKSLFGVLLLLV